MSIFLKNDALFELIAPIAAKKSKSKLNRVAAIFTKLKYCKV